MQMFKDILGPWPVTPETGTHKKLHSVTLSQLSAQHSGLGTSSHLLHGKLRSGQCDVGGRASASVRETVK